MILDAVAHSNLIQVAFYKKKQAQRGGKETEYAKVIKISPAEGGAFPFCYKYLH
jgi:hypothetical protein